MRGDKIPKITQYTITENGTISRKVPMYKLLPKEVVKAKQDALGDHAYWYFGVHCKKCCGVYPAIMSEAGFNDLCYFVCLVCGKESAHKEMPWIATEAWNNRDLVYDPAYDDIQLTLFDWMGEKNNLKEV